MTLLRRGPIRISIGTRIEFHPNTEIAMRGDRYGTVVRHQGQWITIQGDRAGKRYKVTAASILRTLDD